MLERFGHRCIELLLVEVPCGDVEQSALDGGNGDVGPILDVTGRQHGPVQHNGRVTATEARRDGQVDHRRIDVAEIVQSKSRLMREDRTAPAP